MTRFADSSDNSTVKCDDGLALANINGLQDGCVVWTASRMLATVLSKHRSYPDTRWKKNTR
jgi:hypothetical protein